MEARQPTREGIEQDAHQAPPEKSAYPRRRGGHAMSNPMLKLMEALEDARRARDPGADWLNLITVDSDGFPVARIMTIRGVSAEAVVVTAARSSPKMRQLEDNGCYEAHLFWPKVLGQARIRGSYRIEDPPELAEGWRGRAYGGKIVDLYQVHCRPQSSVVASREVLLRELADLQRRFPSDRAIEKPPEVVNLVLLPDFLELWIGDATDRMHDRRRYTRQADDWLEEILVP
jgi:pyridoxamine 5'-phosphate oxidase